jgi:DNA-binding HxlR family transcriptional regulator
MYTVNGNQYSCSVLLTLDIFNDKWKLAIIWQLLSEEMRFKALHERMSDITQKTLTIKLKELEEKHIVHREVFAEVPPKVVYSLTPTGEKLRAVLKEMYQWGIFYVNEHGKVSGDDVCCEVDISKKLGF